eukprot:9469686-Pyramimonas_sp.AAC.1
MKCLEPPSGSLRDGVLCVAWAGSRGGRVWGQCRAPRLPVLTDARKRSWRPMECSRGRRRGARLQIQMRP